MNLQVLARNVRRLRLAKKLSQKKLADSAGLSLLTVKKLEGGGNKPTIRTLEAIARALNVKFQDLFLPVRELKTVHFRSSKRMQNRENILADVSRWLDDYNYLEDILGEYLHFRLEAILERCSRKDIIAAANLCRGALELGPAAPIHDICGLLEYAGVKLNTISCASHDFFGLSIAYQNRFNRKLSFKEEPPGNISTEPDGLPSFDFYEERFSRLVRKAVEQDEISLSRGAEILRVSIEEMRDRVKSWEVI